MKLKKSLFLLLALGFTLCLPGVKPVMANSIQPVGVQQVTAQPPQIDIHVDGLNGLSGWYRSIVTVSALAAFGPLNLEMRADGGDWQPVNSIRLTEDGIHRVEIRTTGTGNQVTMSKEVRIDQHDPIGQFTAPQGGTAVQGVVEVSGTVHDALSGMGQVVVSLDDGKTWQAVPLRSDGSWSVSWDTHAYPDGMHAVQAKFTDQAGNTSSAEIFYIVANHPAQIQLTPRWPISEKGRLDIRPGEMALMDVTVDITDPQNRWPAVHRDYSPHHTPQEIAWDGKFGQAQAPAGEYNVTVKVTDQMAQEYEAHGVIVVPPVTTPTAKPSATPTNPTRLWLVLIPGAGVLIAFACIAVYKADLGPFRKFRQAIMAIQHKHKE